MKGLMNTLFSALFFMLKTICKESYQFPYNLLQWFSQSYSQTFWVTNLYQFSAQPTRKDKTNPKINNTKSVKK